MSACHAAPPKDQIIANRSNNNNRRELLLLEGISLQGLGNWQAIAEHVGTRTKDEIQKHYNSVYVDSPHWPVPVSLHFDISRTIADLRMILSEWTFDLTLIRANFKNANADEYHQ